MRCFCRVEYDGTAYAGWQIQDNDKSIQSELESAFTIVVRRPCKVVGAGRTDAGVHGRGQGMHIDLPGDIDLRKCKSSVNAVLPDDIAVFDFQKVDDSFHARFSAIERCYKYYIVSRKMPLWQGRALPVAFQIDWKLVNENIPFLLGRHDFGAFCSSGSSAGSKVCDIRHAGLEEENGIHTFTIKADRFIYKMVRSIVGTLIDIGRGRITEPLDKIIDSRDRTLVGDTVSACGLVLEYVAYSGVK